MRRLLGLGLALAAGGALITGCGSPVAITTAHAAVIEVVSEHSTTTTHELDKDCGSDKESLKSLHLSLTAASDDLTKDGKDLVAAQAKGTADLALQVTADAALVSASAADAAADTTASSAGLAFAIADANLTSAMSVDDHATDSTSDAAADINAVNAALATYNTTQAANIAAGAASAAADTAETAAQTVSTSAHGVVFGDTLAVNAIKSDLKDDQSDVDHFNVSIKDADADLVTDGCIPVVIPPTPTPSPTASLSPSPKASPTPVATSVPTLAPKTSTSTTTTVPNVTVFPVTGTPDTGAGMGGAITLASILGLSGATLLGASAYRRRRSS